MYKRIFYIIIFLLIGCQTREEDRLFKLIPGSKSGIKFSNELNESYAENMLYFSNFYNGGGVGILDVNNDGLQDIILGGNQVSCRLYLNKGGLKFEDITEQAGMVTDRWITGISVVDINSDGLDDVYFSVSGFSGSKNTLNQLFVNNGNNTFTELAEEFGLAEKEHTTHTSFFDYDEDGDLDAFMAINPSDYSLFYMGRRRMPKLNGEARSTDKLYENRGNGKFIDVSKKAGILAEGYSLGVNTSDFNNDGLVDIYVTNDFIQNDLLYMNNGDGTFTNKLHSFFDYTSYASMGIDVADINNDGLVDILTLDMLPEESKREKMLVPTSGYNAYEHTLSLGYEPQFSRNVLQLNNGDGTFSEIGQLAGISRTDWSWSSLFGDFNNDGFKDLYVTNGFRRDLGNLDYIVYYEYSPFTNPGSNLKDQIDGIHNTPGLPISNYAFKNNGDLTFSNKIEEWGFELPTFSSGVALADLDLDGDLDIIVNNVDMEAALYENQSELLIGNHYIKIRLQGTENNRSAFGAKIFIHAGHREQMIEFTPYRGYLSSVGDVVHFGLGNEQKVDSLVVEWPDGKWSRLSNIDIDTTITVSHIDAKPNITKIRRMLYDSYTFRDVTESCEIDFRHKENNQVDFYKQPLLPHQHSRLGPGVAVGDVNGDGLDDCYIGGASGQTGELYIQQSDATFQSTSWIMDAECEDMGVLFFDYDMDGDNDLYVASGGILANLDRKFYQDRLYENDGKGNFKKTEGVLPEFLSSSGAVIASDFDKDGDLDLFIAGRIVPTEYPSKPKSRILRNEGEVFVDVTEMIAPGLSEVGMVTQGLWTDFDNDNDLDLMLVGEWMPVCIFENTNGQFKNISSKLGLHKSNGWWNSITPSDQNADGFIDYTLGNLGANNDYNASSEHPLLLKSKDFDNNGSIDLVLLKEFSDGNYPVASRDAFLGQLKFMRSTYPSYQSYAKTNSENLFEKKDWEGTITDTAFTLDNSILRNFEGDSLVISSMMNTLQLAPIYGGINIDIDSDGIEETVLSGNNFSNNVVNGPYASSNGTMIKWQEDGYTWSRGHENGLNFRGDRKGLATIKFANNFLGIISTVNNGNNTVHRVQSNISTLPYEHDEYRAYIEMSDGRTLTRECYYGSGYLSQSCRQLFLPEGWQSITFLSFTDGTRVVKSEIE